MHPFQLMAEPVRRRIVEILASGEHTSGNITSVVGHEFAVTRSAVGRHLAILLDEDWVTVRADYTHRYYRLQPNALGALQVQKERIQQAYVFPWAHTRDGEGKAGAPIRGAPRCIHRIALSRTWRVM